MQAYLTIQIFIDTINTATATGYDSIGNKMTDTVLAEVNVINPMLELVKTCCPSSLYAPADILYKFTIVNIGDSTLTNITVYDETLDTLILGPLTLAPGKYAEESLLQKNLTNGTYINIANATAIDILGEPLFAYSQTTCTIRASEQEPGPTEDGKPTLCDFNNLIATQPSIVVFPTTETVKPLDCNPAAESDWTASAYITSRMNDYTEALDIDENYINQTTGSPIAGPKTGIFTFGGPIVNPLVKHYETSYPLNPMILFSQNSTHYMFTYANGTIVEGSILPLDVINNNIDMFLIEIFQNQENHTIMILYGYGWKGTYAAGKYFDRVIYENPAICNNSWLVVKWNDANQDGFVNMPDDGDEYTIIATN